MQFARLLHEELCDADFECHYCEGIQNDSSDTIHITPALRRCKGLYEYTCDVVLNADAKKREKAKKGTGKKKKQYSDSMFKITQQKNGANFRYRVKDVSNNLQCLFIV
jgi:hypothetical protein